jgi:hypothetical protein
LVRSAILFDVPRLLRYPDCDVFHRVHQTPFPVPPLGGG